MSRSFPGARWWKVDFHTHTPASIDYAKGALDQTAIRAQMTPSDWLLGFMRAEIDAVVVTDHNSGDWIDRLKNALADLREAQGSEFRELVLFPGVEITANGGAHILAVLSPTASSADITALLGEVKYRGTLGASDSAAECSPIEVVRAIVARRGIPILAHVDGANSAFSATGNTLAPLLELADLYAMEVCDSAWQPHDLYRARKLNWSRVLGSDSHHPWGSPGQRFPGSHFTWVKMETPSHEGLRLSLLDGDELSVRRSDQTARDQNAHAHVVIESVEVLEARYCGRSTPPGQSPLRVALSPWLTTIIGGRGTGKSTIVEFSRIALRRAEELPDAIKADFTAFNAVATKRGDRGVLTDKTQVRLIIWKDGARYSIQWDPSGSAPSLQEERGDSWISASGDVARRFPVRLFSQGQIFEMARDGRALLRIIDEAPNVDAGSWRSEWKSAETRYFALCARVREYQNQLAERPTLQGELDDALRKIEVFEQAEHAQTLRDFHRSQQQRHAVEAWEAALANVANEIRSLAERVSPPVLDTSMFDELNSADNALLKEVALSRDEVAELSRRIGALADEATDRHESWTETASRSAWATEARQIEERYNVLVDELRARGLADPDAYKTLVQQRRSLEDRIKVLDEVGTTMASVVGEVETTLAELGRLRSELTARRQTFLSGVLRDNRHVRMTVEPYGTDPAAAEQRFREVVARTDGLADDILSADQRRGCLADLYRGLPADPTQRRTTLEERLTNLKSALRAAAAGASETGGWFARHLQKLTPEQLDRLMLWFPADELAVSYSPGGDGRDFRSLEQGSPGQKTAAILAFLLAHGDEPIVLDQPEDDLDNELIYQLIVAQLRLNKRHRQVVVVTHNPNIVVNGDAELIIVMTNRAGQCRLLHSGSLQSSAIREDVCKVMEGGREALEKRYRRMTSGYEGQGS